MKASLETRVSQMGLDSFVDINIFVKNIILFSFFKFSIFLQISQIKIYTNVRPQKSKVSFNDTLLNFGLKVLMFQTKNTFTDS